VVFTSDGRRNNAIDTQNCETNAVLHELYRSLAKKCEHSNTAKLSAFTWVISPILTHGHESWVMTESVLSQVQAAEIEYLRRVNGMALRNKVRSCESRKA